MSEQKPIIIKEEEEDFILEEKDDTEKNPIQRIREKTNARLVQNAEEEAKIREEMKPFQDRLRHLKQERKTLVGCLQELGKKDKEHLQSLLINGINKYLNLNSL